tara:strand:- start:378 stop:995 length:618 start_codon:yes stop_codon:yes gene_type:complete
MKIGIINYGMGNIRSVQNILNYMGTTSEIITKPNQLISKTHIILPGVGSYKKAMKNLKKLKLDLAIKDFVKKKNSKILGICLGMQLLGSSSEEEGHTKGLNFVKVNFELFKCNKSFKIPHVGFNTVIIKKDKYKFLNNLKNDSDFYFNHSFRAKHNEEFETEILCDYGNLFLAAFRKKNIYGTQFHPEKSQSNGLILLRNFLLND